MLQLLEDGRKISGNDSEETIRGKRCCTAKVYVMAASKSRSIHIIGPLKMKRYCELKECEVLIKRLLLIFEPLVYQTGFESSAGTEMRSPNSILVSSSSGSFVTYNIFGSSDSNAAFARRIPFGSGFETQ